MNLNLTPHTTILRTLLWGTGILSGAIVISLSPALAATTSAQAAAPSSTTYQANLTQLNNSGASGTATVAVNNNDVTITVRATGSSANRAHAAHIYVGGQATCPATTADTNKDGYIDNNEAKPSRGDLKVSLTTSGDTGPNSALAFNRMPVADKDGKITYSRSFTLPSSVKAADLTKATISFQGISTLFADKAIYDGDKRSELTQDHAFETTVPAACGKLSTSPIGGAATGVGSIAGVESPALLITGVITLAGAAAATFAARKQLFSKQQ